MPKRRERSTEEWLRGQLREANKEIRQLRRQLKELQKHERHFEEVLTEKLLFEEEIKGDCPKCKSGFLQTTDFKFITITKCNSCTYYAKSKN